MNKCYCETTYDGYCGYCFDKVEQERDEAEDSVRRLTKLLSDALFERDEAQKQLEYANGKLSEAVDKLQELRGIILGSGGMEGEQ